MKLEIRAGFSRKKTEFKNRITEIKGHKDSIKKKLVLSAGLGAAIFSTNWIGIPAFAVNTSGLVENLVGEPVNTSLALGIAYGFNIGVMLANLNQQRRLLQNENIEMSQDFSATVICHGLEKINRLKEKRVERSIASILTPNAAATPLFFTRESTLISLAALTPNGMWGLIILKSTQGVFNMIQMGAAEIALRTVGKEKKKTQDLPTRGVVVDLKQKS